MTRLSGYFLPTEKQAPADAEALSHRLLVRAGMVRQVGAGLWSWLPAGWRVHQRIVQVVREEMNAIGGQELLMPVLNPAELWQKSGRYQSFGAELFRFEDRRGAPMVLATTHEEVVTMHVAQVVRSYRDLPFILYHFQVKERDEPRPRAGVLRTREFVMKDAYTFDRDPEGLDVGYRKHIDGLRPDLRPGGAGVVPRGVRRRRDGRVGRARVHGAVPGGGERRGAGSRLRGQRRGGERRRRSPSSSRRALDAPEPVETPGMTTIAAVAAHVGAPAGALLKAFPIIVDGRGLVLLMLRGDHRVNDIKLRNALGAEFRPAHPDEFAQPIGPPGFIGPVGAQAPILLDEGVDAAGGYITGANRPDEHLRGVEPGRDFPFERIDARRVEPGDTVDGRAIRVEPAIEVANIFKLGTRYSEPLGATYLDEEGARQADLDGLLRDRPGPHRRRRRRAVRRRAGHRLAARDRAVGRGARRARQAGLGGARAGRPALRRAARRRARRALRRSRRRPGREVRRRRAARRPAAPHRGAADGRRGRGRGAGAPRPRGALRPLGGRRRGGG